MSTTRRVDQSKRSPADILERQPPCDIEAELGVLGSMMLKPDVCDEIAPILREMDFYDPAHQRLFSHMLEMHTSGKRIDVTLLVDRLKKSGDYDLVGGPGYLARVSQAVPNAAHAKYYANIVHEKSTYRSLIDASTDILQKAYGQTAEAKDLLSSAENSIFSLMDKRTFNNVSSIRDVLLEAMERIDARLKGEQVSSGVETGFGDMDELTGGLHNSELIILAARPSMGKTALAMNIASNVAVEQNAPVLFVSLEMSSLELADRMLCSVGRIDGHKLRNGRLPSDQRRRLVDVASRISQAPLYVDDSPARSVTEIAAAARRIGRREEKLGLIVIDYLQLIEPDNPSDPRQEQVAKIARRLKGMARELKVPVLCLAQVNRQAEDSREHRPRLSHLRESGAIEQDADVVMFVHREEYYLRGEERDQRAGEAEVIISKQRNGPVGDVELVWRKEYTRFEDKAPARLEEFDSYADPAPNSDF